MNVIKFYKYLSSTEYTQLKSYACGLILVIGSIYLCEKGIFKNEIH